MSAEIPDHKDIIDRLHQHDLRLTRVEVQQTSMANEISEQTGRLEKMSDRLDRLSDKIERLTLLAGELDGRQKIILAVITVGVPLIISMEIWAGLR